MYKIPGQVTQNIKVLLTHYGLKLYKRYSAGMCVLGGMKTLCVWQGRNQPSLGKVPPAREAPQERGCTYILFYNTHNVCVAHCQTV